MGALEGHTGAISCVAGSSDGKLLATGSTDCTVRIWSGVTYEQLGAITVSLLLNIEYAVFSVGHLVFKGSTASSSRLLQ